ncbi:MAG: MMPL family transporter [Myxococcales bacterium]|nr:MMPL family transporter [Myxococcales bacterium]
MESLGRKVLAHRTLVIALSTLVLLVSALLIARGGALTSIDTIGTEAWEGRTLIDRELHLPGETSFIVVFSSARLDTDTPAFGEAMRAALAPLRRDPRVASVMAPETLPEAVADRLRSEDAHHALAVVTMRGSYREAAREFASVRAMLAPGPLQMRLTGHLAFRADLDKTLEHDLLLAEALSLPLALLVLLWVFRTAVAALLPVFVGGLAVAAGIAGVMVLSHYVDVAAYAINVASLIGLGVAIDYSLFIVSRYRDELRRGRSYDDALVTAMNTAGRAVAFSGLAVGIGLSGLIFLRGSFLAPMGLAGAIVVLFAVLFALTFLPALLAVLGPRIHAGAMPFARSRPEDGGRWARLAHAVMRRPVAVLVPVLVLLLALAGPFLRLRLAVADVSILPTTAEARQGYDLLRRHFPDHAATRIFVVNHFASGAPVLNEARALAMYDQTRQIAAIGGVRTVESVVNLGDFFDRASTAVVATTPTEQLSPEVAFLRDATVGRSIAVVQVLVDAAPASDEARAVVNQIRAHRTVADGRVIVTGQTADDLDVTRFIEARAPAAIGWVVAMTLLVLFVLLRSVLLPIKAVLMNFLSIGASFGALVFIFQEGHGASLLRFTPGPIDPTLPVLLFCSVFGLSMDYEVLMLTRMHEVFEQTGDNTRAVAEGLEETGRLITSAAAIMVSVFAAFALATVVAMKAMGVALALAVALDATLVRVLVVPSTMRLLGALNWWAPAAIKRWLGPASRH